MLLTRCNCQQKIARFLSESVHRIYKLPVDRMHRVVHLSELPLRDATKLVPFSISERKTNLFERYNVQKYQRRVRNVDSRVRKKFSIFFINEYIKKKFAKDTTNEETSKWDLKMLIYEFVKRFLYF